MTEPVVITNQILALSGSLDTASKELYRLQSEYDDAAEAYEDIRNDLLVALLDDFDDQEKRLPGEDVRNALVTKQMRKDFPQEFGKYRRLKAELKRGEDRAKRIERQISALQSVLSMLKTELQAAGA